MGYIIVKKIKVSGCFALKAKAGKELASYVNQLQEELNDVIEIVYLTNPDMYGEYKPYHYVNNFKELSSKARQL